MPSGNKDQWVKETLGPAIERYPERQESFVTDSGVPIDSLYVPEDLEATGQGYNERLGYPGEYPFTRGVQPNTYRGRVWTMRQYSGYSHCRRDQRAVPVSSATRPDRAVGGFRPAHPDRLRL